MQTVPLLDYDEKVVLWERADNLRRSGEYDRAADIYDQLAALDDGEPDVFWSRMLCRYGVEYVEENGTNRRIPTINRIQYKAVIDDEDYRAALKLADGDQQRLYVVQAMQLEELRKEILSVSMTAQPYDIFICYKENDASGRRTDDSVLAGQLYRSLTAEGWRVFFARISLEDKAGTEYEPYIFAALNSAKLMLAVGTSPENFNAVWVRNEWNRYLYRISERNEGSLVVLYKNMLPQHLPQEFAHLQTFDMSAPDYMEELLRGVRKMLSSPRQIAVRSAEDTTAPEAASAASLLRRAELSLEDGDLSRADEFCELALNCEPENADIYLIKLFVEYRVRSIDELAKVTADFTQSGNYKKVIRFGDEKLAEKLSDTYRLSLYNRYCIELENSVYESQCDGVAARFASLGDYLDSIQKVDECKQKAKRLAEERVTASKERKYTEAKSKLDGLVVDSAALSIAEKKLRELGDYKDSSVLADKCAEKLSAMAAQQEKELAAKAAMEEKQRQLSERNRKTFRKVLLIGVPALAVLIVGGILINQISLSSRYNNAVELCEQGDYDSAMQEFVELADYKDSFDRIKLTRYQKAMSLFDSKDYTAAMEEFIILGAYKDSHEMLLTTKYCLADEAAAALNYEEAISMFDTLGDYNDSKERALLLRYDLASSLKDKGDYISAASKYEALGEYLDSQEQVIICRYSYAQQLFDNKEYVLAIDAFTELGSYADSAEKAISAKYEAAGQYVKNGDYQNACRLYSALGDYSDSKSKLLEAQYDFAAVLADSNDYEKALRYYRELAKERYLDSEEKIISTTYAQARYYAENDRYTEALDVLAPLEQDEAQQLIKDIRYSYALYFYENEQYNEALQQLEHIAGYKDAEAVSQQVRYDLAQTLFDKGSYDEAYKLYKELGSYSDAVQKLKHTEKMIFCSSVKGDVITFGTYEQNNVLSDGGEPIQWIVLDRQEDKILVLSRYCLERSDYGAYTWEDSSIRAWLNGDFYSNAFTAEEKARIITTTVENCDNTQFNTYGGENTIDNLFLLSDDEVSYYFDEYADRMTKRTKYSFQKYYDQCYELYGDRLLNPPQPDDYVTWWLRSVGEQFCIDTIHSTTGSISNTGMEYQYKEDIRPAMWIDVSE